MAKKPNKLSDLEIFEVSLVDKAANKRKFLLKKSEETSMNEEILKAAQEIELDNEDAITEAVQKAELSEKGAEAGKLVLQVLKAASEDLPKEFYADLVTLAGGELPVKEVEKIVEVEKKTDEDRIAALEKKLTESKDLSDEDKETLNKALEETKLAKEIAENIRKDFEKEQDLRKQAEFVQKAKEEFKNLPDEKEKLGVMLKKANESLEEEDYNEFYRFLKAADEAIASRKDFENVGTSMTTSSTAWDKISNLAKEKVEKSDSKITFSKAVDLVMHEQPDLYEEYKQEVN